MDEELQEIINARQQDLMNRIKAKWTDEELKLLYEHYESKTLLELSKIITTKSRGQIAETAKRLGLNKRKDFNKGRKIIPWSDEEIKLLKTHARNMTLEELAKKLPGRSETAINSRCAKLGICTKSTHHS